MTGEGLPVRGRAPLDLDLLGGLGEQARALAVAGFAAIWRREALPLGAAAPLAAALAAGGRCEVDADLLIGIHGLTLRQTRHHFVHGGIAHNTWCAFDSIGIPAALRIDAVAHTDCPSCGRSIRVAIERGAPQVEAELVLWLPDSSGDHLMATFCAGADLYCSTQHLADRIDTSVARGEVVTLEAAAELGRHTWVDVADLELDSRS